jgi:hypothetical protein
MLCVFVNLPLGTHPQGQDDQGTAEKACACNLLQEPPPDGGGLWLVSGQGAASLGSRAIWMRMCVWAVEDKAPGRGMLRMPKGQMVAKEGLTRAGSYRWLKIVSMWHANQADRINRHLLKARRCSAAAGTHGGVEGRQVLRTARQVQGCDEHPQPLR